IYGDLGTSIWLDKTADHVMINCIPFLKEMFPQARFIFLRRHPIAVAESRRRKFGSTPFFAILEWNESIKAWNRHKTHLAQSNIFECDANELRTGQLHVRLGEFLELDKQSCKAVANYLSVKTPEMTRHFPQKNLHAHYTDLEESRRFAFDVLLLSVIESFDVYIEDTDWDANTVDWVKNALGILPEQFGYEIHRPKNLLVDSIIPLVMQIDDYKHTAASNDMTATYWKEQHAHQLANAHYWKEQCRHQAAVAMRWKNQVDQFDRQRKGKIGRFPVKRVAELIELFRERFSYFRKS
ncbi:MAG TPA: sulfotransferase, partial [Burkholderiaceae bacterium]|nr:sulfotransferase [Burkholderiaceae bacterium]